MTRDTGPNVQTDVTSRLAARRPTMRLVPDPPPITPSGIRATTHYRYVVQDGRRIRGWRAFLRIVWRAWRMKRAG